MLTAILSFLWTPVGKRIGIGAAILVLVLVLIFRSHYWHNRANKAEQAAATAHVQTKMQEVETKYAKPIKDMEQIIKHKGVDPRDADTVANTINGMWGQTGKADRPADANTRTPAGNDAGTPGE